MRGMLSFLVLWLLSKKHMYGQEIALEIAKRRGIKPNPGTLYPALKDLERRKLIKSEKSGRRTVYYITKQGKMGIKKACLYFCKAFGEIYEEYKTKATK
jgi:DNA-binding PadR family transcriptional regulator